MDTNECDTNHLHSDLLLPPRKRLLAGLKKNSFSESTCSPNSSPKPLSPNRPCEFDLQLDKLFKSYKNGSKMSPLEIAEASRSKAAKAAKAARADAEEKASIAAKAVVSAKSALDLVSLIHEDMNELKKQVPVHLLYKKYQSVDKCGTDEELARRLHRAMNSSPRISQHYLGSKYKNYKHKKLKILPSSKRSSIGDGNSLGDVSNEESYTARVDDNVSMISSEAESCPSKRKTLEPLDEMRVNGRNRDRIKKNKLPLCKL